MKLSNPINLTTNLFFLSPFFYHGARIPTTTHLPLGIQDIQQEAVAPSPLLLVMEPSTRKLWASSGDYQQALQRIRKALQQEHFKQDQNATRQARLAARADNNKQHNALQKKKGVHDMFEVLGLISYRKINKTDHSEPLLVELLHQLGFRVKEEDPEAQLY